MSLSTLIWMLAVQGTVTFITVYLLIKVLRSKEKDQSGHQQ